MPIYLFTNFIYYLFIYYLFIYLFIIYLFIYLLLLATANYTAVANSSVVSYWAANYSKKSNNDCELLYLPDNSIHENTSLYELQTFDYR